MWRFLSSRLAVRLALGLKHEMPRSGTSGRLANAAISALETSILFVVGLGALQRYRGAAEQKRITQDVAHLHLPLQVEQHLRDARLRLQCNDLTEAFLYAAISAQCAAEAGVLGDELLLALGHIFAVSCSQQPAILHVLVNGHPSVDSVAPEGWRSVALENIHKSLLAMLAQDRSSMPLRWLAVAALSVTPVLTPLVDKLLADSLDADRTDERAEVLPILMDFDLPDLRYLQLAVLHESVASLLAESARQPVDIDRKRLGLASCCLRLAGGLLNDARKENLQHRGAVLRIRCLHNIALHFLPSEADARSPLTTSKEMRDAYGGLYHQRALISLAMGNGLFFREIDAALTWYEPTDGIHAALKTLRASVVLRGLQGYREEHGKELEIRF